MFSKVTKDTWPNVKAILANLINIHKPLLYNTKLTRRNTLS